MSDLSRERIKLYIVTDDNWFINIDKYNEIEKVCQIEDAISFYDEYSAIKLLESCKKLNIPCRIIKYKITYTVVEELKIKGV